jgi:hypothetical protein
VRARLRECFGYWSAGSVTVPVHTAPFAAFTAVAVTT